MSSCPNVNTVEWKALVNKIGVQEAFREFIKNKHEIPDASKYTDTYKGVNATTKVIGALISKAGSESFNKFYLKGNTEKFFLELTQKHGATKQQVENLKVWMDANNPKSLEELLTGLLAETTYGITISPMKGEKGLQRVVDPQDGAEWEEPIDYEYQANQEIWNEGIYEPGTRAYRMELDERTAKLKNEATSKYTDYYKGLTVPGGTNYRENEIATPAIVPSIKGHGSFSTDNGIGWFRSDDREDSELDNKLGGYYSALDEGYVEETSKPKPTRRILEVQSDLFQKSRESSDLVTKGNINSLDNFSTAMSELNRKLESDQINLEEYRAERAKLESRNPKNMEDSSENNFLQLLNKDNNWVSFFIQSIIQDSQFKGYEKVLFPSGNTAAKVEGHETLEGYISTRENRLKENRDFDSRIQKLLTDLSNPNITEFTTQGGDWFKRGDKYYRNDFGTGEEWEITEYDFKDAIEQESETLHNTLDSLNLESSQFEAELDDARNGRAKFSSIANFYETAVYNVLKKKGYNPTKFVDEHGNTWNQVDLNADRDTNTIYFNRESNSAEFEKRVLDYLTKNGLLSQEKIKVEKGEYSLVSSKDRTVSENVAEIEKVNEEYRDKYGFEPYVVEQVGKGAQFIVRVNKEGSVFSNEESNTAEDRIKELADGMSSKLGVKYEFVSATQARSITKEANIQWSGENAFFYKDKVYFVKGQAGLDDAMHEFAHPFVLGLRKSNPDLYTRILADIMQSNDMLMEGIVDSVNTMYNDVSSDSKNDEMIVRALSLLANKNMNTTPEHKNIFQKIMFAIKQLLRKIFGENINLDTLSPNTTLQDLSDILYTGEEDINKVDTQDVHDIFFNREVKKELESYENKMIVKHINNFFHTITDHSQKLRTNSQNYGELAKLFTNEKDNTTLHGNVEKLLKYAIEFEDDAKKQGKKLENFAQAIIGIEIMSKKMRDHVSELIKNGTPEKDLLRTMRYYSFIVNDWQNVFEELRKDNNLNPPLLGEKIKNTIDNFKKVEDHIDNVNKKGLSQFFTELLEPTSRKIGEHLDEQIGQLQEKYDAGRKDLLSRLNEYKDMKRRFTYDEENVLKYLRGQMGDTNVFSALLESYTSSPDVIIGKFATFIRANFNKVLGEMQEYNTRLGNELDPYYKAAGINHSDPEQLGSAITGIDKIFSKDEKDNPVQFEVRTLLNEFGNGWLFDIKNMEYQVQFAKESKDIEKEKTLRAELEDHKEKYFNREYTDDVYQMKKFWNRDDTTRLAQSRRKDITDNLASLGAHVELSPEDIEEIERLQKELKTLGSTKNLDGTTKDGDELMVAKAIQEYNVLSREFYEEVENKNSFNIALDDFIYQLEDNGLTKDSPEYISQMNAWIKNNIRIRPTDAYYDEGKNISTEIDAITAKIPGKDGEKLQIGKIWEDNIEQVKGFRDNNGQPIGNEFSDPKVAAIKKNQEDILEIRDTFRKLSGLNLEQAAKMQEFYDKIEGGSPLTAEEKIEFDALNKIREAIPGLDKADMIRLTALYKQLDMLKSKLPTEYYLDTINTKAKELGVNFNISIQDMEKPLTVVGMDDILSKNDVFNDWFQKNHIVRNQWNDTTSQTEEVYERLYIWNRMVPNDKVLLDALRNNDYEKLVNYSSKYVEVRKASKYYSYRIKGQYRNERVVGKNVDNRGNWLPKTMAEGAADNKYENKEYFRLKNSTDTKDKALFNILQTYKKYHLKSQEDAPGYTKMWYELPRLRKEKIEEVHSFMREPGEAIGRIFDWGKLQFSRKSKEDDFDRGDMTPEEIREQNKMYVSSDLWGNERGSIPMKHMGKLDVDKVSLDVGRSISLYAISIKNNKMLHDINPIAQALQSVLDKEGVQDLNKKARKNWTKNLNIPILSSTNTRAQAIRNMIERDINGIEHKMEFGLFAHRMAKHITGMAAFGSLTLNIPNGIKNVAAARIQNIIESLGKESFTTKDWANASGDFLTNYLPALVNDYNKFSGRGLQTQMFELFDPVEGKYEEHLGNSFTASYKKDIVNLRFLTSPQKLGELNAQGTAMLAMMKNTYIDQIENGVSKKITYDKAWTVTDGVITLKPGIDPKWGRNGSEFLDFKMKMHKVNELLQGAYAKGNQPEAARTTTYQLVGFMRKYLTPGIVNRFATNRPNFALGTLREGYYATFWRVTKDMFQSKLKNWDTYSDKEKTNFFKTLSEVGYSLVFMALLALMGYDNDDKDRYTKLRSSSWAYNMAVYELIMIKGEAETFLPLPGMGMNEILRMKDNPSIAFPILNKYYKIVEHMWDYVRDPLVKEDLSHYTHKQGIYQKGDLKLKADLLKIIGYTGNTANPLEGIRNYSNTMNRY